MSAVYPLHIAHLLIYPIKSCAPISCDSVGVTLRGLELDRAWMLVDSNGRFISQRQHPKMALIKPILSKDTMTLHAPKMEPLCIPINLNNTPIKRANVQIWKSTVDAAHVSSLADAWFHSFLGQACHLMHMDSDAKRMVNPVSTAALHQKQDTFQVGFADSYPFLVLSQASIEDVNARTRHVDMEAARFRPNIIIEGAQAWEEDGWHKITREDHTLELFMLKPCSRCAIINIEPTTGECKDGEPLRQLASWRRGDDGQIHVGQHAVAQGLGTLQVNDRFFASPRY